MDIKVLPYIDPDRVGQRRPTATPSEQKTTASAESAGSFDEAMLAAERAIESLTIDLIVSQDSDNLRRAADVLSQSKVARLRKLGQNLINTGAGTGRVLTPEQVLGDSAGQKKAATAQNTLSDNVAGTENSQRGQRTDTSETATSSVTELSASGSYSAGSDLAADADKAAEALGCPSSLKPLFIQAAKKYDVDVALLMAIAKQESDFHANAVSHAGATGIMQIMPATAKELGVKDLYDPRDNIMGGAKEISSRLKDYDGDLPLALAGYNAGIGNVRKYGGIPPFKETKDYIKKVSAYYEKAS